MSLGPGPILQFLPDGSAGGGGTVVLGLVQALVPEVETHVLTEHGSYVADRAKALGAIVHEGSFFRRRFDFGAMRTFESVVASSTPKLIHLHGGRALFFARRVRHPAIVYTVHGYHFLHRGFLDRMMGRLVERASIGNVREVAFVCEYDRMLGLEMGALPPGLPSRVIYNGVERPTMEPPEPCPGQIAFLSRLVYQKDPLLAVEVMRQLAGEGFRLVMIGGGDMEDAVRQASADLGPSIDVRGSVTRETALRLVAESEVMLMTSRWEGLPLAPLEAMSLGVPVVAPAVAGIPEIVESGVDGMLVEDRNPSSFADAIRSICDDPVRKASIVAAARAKVDRVFSWSVCLERYQDLYRQALEGSASNRQS